MPEHISLNDEMYVYDAGRPVVRFCSSESYCSCIAATSELRAMCSRVAIMTMMMMMMMTTMEE